MQVSPYLGQRRTFSVGFAALFGFQFCDDCWVTAGPGTVFLMNLMFHLPFDKTEYEPEQFPGLIYRLENPKVVFLIFSSGKCVITGSKDLAEAQEAEDALRDELLSF